MLSMWGNKPSLSDYDMAGRTLGDAATLSNKRLRVTVRRLARSRGNVYQLSRPLGRVVSREHWTYWGYQVTPGKITITMRGGDERK